MMVIMVVRRQSEEVVGEDGELNKMMKCEPDKMKLQVSGDGYRGRRTEMIGNIMSADVRWLMVTGVDVAGEVVTVGEEEQSTNG
ncbi:hypothetical protein HanIR_Chr17g0874591 [Helianthus annuus]|nr:hypothetical protein HanIR_Chr17g0874591 [Helianthus annuus]